MNYRDILNAYKQKLPMDRQWWPNCFYHFTDIHNAVSIIESGWIYSRAQAEEKEIMVHDNASRVVIDMTENDKRTYGRLYFRPLTPTQYNNEGYKPECIRNPQLNASCPVPVFFMLSVEKTMSLDRVMFAEKGISGNRQKIQQGVDAFAALNFDKIYHDGSYNPQTDGDIKDYRHSEIIREGGFPLPKIVRGIVCRSNAERETFLYLLKKQSKDLYESYKIYIMYAPSKRMFYNNGIFIKNVFVRNRILYLELNSKENRYGRSEERAPFQLRVSITYLSLSGEQIQIVEGQTELNYSTVENIGMELEKDLEYSSIIVKVMFDDAVMYENELCLLDDAVI